MICTCHKYIWIMVVGTMKHIWSVKALPCNFLCFVRVLCTPLYHFDVAQYRQWVVFSFKNVFSSFWLTYCQFAQPNRNRRRESSIALNCVINYLNCVQLSHKWELHPTNYTKCKSNNWLISSAGRVLCDALFNFQRIMIFS